MNRGFICVVSIPSKQSTALRAGDVVTGLAPLAGEAVRKDRGTLLVRAGQSNLHVARFEANIGTSAESGS